MLEPNKKNIFMRGFDFLHDHIIAVIIIVVLLAGTLSTLYIVEENNIKNNKKENNGMEYVSSDTVYFAMDKTENLNPYTSSSEDVYYISQLIYSSLFRLDSTLTPVPDLVEHYTPDKEEGKVDIKLKKDIKFSNGKELTAEDVSRSVEFIKREGEASPYYNYVSKINYIHVNGEHSLEVVFKDKNNASIDNLVFPVVSEEDYEEDKNNVPGSGPYRYKSYDSHKALYLKPNKYYYGEIPENNIEVKVLPDKTKAVNLMEIDAVTACFLEMQDADMVAEDFNFKEHPVVSGEAEFLGFNFDNYILSHKEMRQAIAYAIDTDTIVKDNYGGSAVTSDTIYYPGFLGSENKGDMYQYNQNNAVKILDNLGYRDTDEDGIIENEKGKELRFKIIVNKNDKNRVLTAKQISAQLEQVGIKSVVKKLSWNEYEKALENGNFDLYLGGFNFDKQYNLKKLFEKGNTLRYNNIALLNDIKKLETAVTAETQKKTFAKIQDKLIEEIPYYCLCYKTYAFLTVEHFESETIPTFFDRFRGCQNWKWEKAVSTEKTEESDED